jgi:c-Jun-amino-terminal kinase-interacting protein 4
MQEHEKGIKDLENQQMSSLVWLCTSARGRSEVTIVDANSPGDVLENFTVCQSNVLCIAAVPGLCDRSACQIIYRPAVIN